MYRLKSVAPVVTVLLAGWLQPSLAQTSDDSLALKIANSVAADRFFIRAGVIGVKIKTESGDAYDVTGPLVTKAELQEMQDTGIITEALMANGVDEGTATDIQDRLQTELGISLVLNSMTARNITALGSPRGVKAVAKEQVGTAGLSLGMFLDDEYKWAVEAYVLAVPPKATVTASGPSLIRPPDVGNGVKDVQQPFPLQGQKIIDTKLFPPLLMLGRYWGNKDSKFRPYTGIMGMYAVFYDTKATDALNMFVGGQNPGDTTVSFKNTFGMGPMLGGKFQFNDSWHINFNIGHVKLKTVGTLVTRNTLLTAKTTGVKAYGDPEGVTYSTEASITSALKGAEGALWSRYFDPVLDDRFDSVTNIVSRVVAYQRYIEAGGDPALAPANQGTFVRKADSTLKNTLFMLSVGHTF